MTGPLKGGGTRVLGSYVEEFISVLGPINDVKNLVLLILLQKP